MKRMISGILILALVLSVLPLDCFATDTETVVKRYADGSYMTETLSVQTARASGSKTGTKTRSYYNADDTLAWQVVLTGKFTYTGSTATCTSSSVSTNIYESGWYTVSKSATKSGNSANGTAVIGEKVLGVTLGKVQVDLTLSCDANGNLS